MGKIIVYLLAMAANGFDSTVINPALPLIAEDFGVHGVALSAVEWAFLIASAVVLPAAGRCASTFSAQRVFVWCLGGFTAGLALSASAQSLGWLVAGRVVQGVASGVLVPVGLAMVYRGATGAQRLRIAQITLVPLTIAPMLGPVAGGFIAGHVGWRWVFAVIIPVVLCTAAAAMFVLHPQPVNKLERGLAGLLTGCVACAAVVSAGPLFVAGINPGQSLRLAHLVAGCALAVVGVVAGRRALATGDVDVTMRRAPAFGPASWFIALASAGLAGFLFVVPLNAAAYGSTPQQIGLLMFPETVGLLVGGQCVAALASRLGAWNVAAAGAVAACAVVVAVLTLSIGGPLWVSMLAMAAFSMCLSQGVLLAQTAAFYGMGEDDTDEATSMLMIHRGLASAWGVAVVAAALAISPAAAAVTISALILAGVAVGARLGRATWQQATV